MSRWLVLCCLFGLLGCGAEAPPDGLTENGPDSQQETSHSEVAATNEVSPELQKHLEEANKFLKVGDIGRAIDILSLAISEHPENPQAYRVRAVLYQKSGQPASAIADYSQAARMLPDNAGLRDDYGFYLFSLGRMEDAERHLRQAVKLEPKSASYRNHLGLALIAQRKLEPAIDVLNEAIELKPEFVDAWINRGYAQYELKQFDRAMADYDKALELNPKALNAHNNKGLVHFQRKEFNEAIVEFTKCVMGNSNNPKYYEHRRLAYLQLGMTKEARADEKIWEKLQQLHLVNTQITRNPGNATGYVARGELHLRDGNVESALADFHQAVNLNPRSAQVWFSRAKAFFKQNELDKAAEDCAKALAIQPHQAIWSLRGDINLKLGRVDQALADFESARRLDDAVAEAYLMKAQELDELGQPEEAAKFREKATTLSPDASLTPSAN